MPQVCVVTDSGADLAADRPELYQAFSDYYRQDPATRATRVTDEAT